MLAHLPTCMFSLPASPALPIIVLVIEEKLLEHRYNHFNLFLSCGNMHVCHWCSCDNLTINRAFHSLSVMVSSNYKANDKINVTAAGLARWLSWLKGCPKHQKDFTGSVPGQGTYSGCGVDLLSGSIWTATDGYFSYINVSLCPLLPLFLQWNLLFLAHFYLHFQRRVVSAIPEPFIHSTV